ncbi:MAG TPA: pitrilysin family protein [Meiothermus sp.]|nr:pitrilysin family protein [Meiothermus sp.]
MAVAQVETLASGLTLAVEEQPWNPGVAFQLLVPVGSTTDPQGMEGAANLLEGWLWKGAGDLDARALAEAFDDLGVRRGSGVGLEYTTFAASFLPEYLDSVLELYALVLQKPRFEEALLEPVRQVALQELAALEDQPPRKMGAVLRRAVFASTHGRYAAGSKEGLTSATPEALRRDFQNRYGAKGSILAVAGGVSFAEVQGAVERHLGSWGGAAPASPQPVLTEPQAVSLEQDTAQVQIGLIYRDVGPGHPEFYAARLAAEVLSGGMGSRLFTEVREKRGLVYSVSASPQGVKGFSYLLGYAGTTPERAQTTLEVLQAEIERIREGVSEEELERAKIGLRTALVMQEESARSRVSSMARDLFMLGRIRPLSEIEAEIAAVDLPRINRFLAENPYQDPWVGTLGPKRLEAISS